MGMGGPDDNAAQANHLVPSTGDVAHCLNAGGMGRLDYEAETLVAHSLRADGPGHDPVGSRVRQGMAVRRLTPVECERLQGFPDDYTAIKYRGKPAADGPRYRAMGNSMAVPVLRWIGKRIQMVEEARAAS